MAVKSPLERQQWIHPILHDRLTHGMLTTLYHSLRSFFFFSRMPVKSFDDFSDSLRRAYLQAAPSDEGLYLSLVGVQPVVVSYTTQEHKKVREAARGPQAYTRQSLSLKYILPILTYHSNPYIYPVFF